MSEIKESTGNDIRDYVGHGFHEIDPQAIRTNPPKIKWREGWYERTSESKLSYLERLAASMNQAALLIQEERDELAKLCELKEAQLEQMKQALDQNLQMLQSEVTRLNEDRQHMLATVKERNTRIRELEKENEEFKAMFGQPGLPLHGNHD